MKKILIALDYDPSAQKVAEKGYDLAVALGAETVLLHVIADSNYYASLQFSPIMGFGGFNDINTLPMADGEVLRNSSLEYLEKTKEHLDDDTILTMVEEGEPANVINQVAKEVNADIIVIGSHSRRGIDKILMGSVSKSVLQHAIIPLFIVPNSENIN